MDGETTWEIESAKIIQAGFPESYDCEAVMAHEKRIFDIVDRRKDLWIPEYPQAPDHVGLLKYCFGSALSGIGVLDVGTGKAGVFCADYLNNNFSYPHMCTDAFECTAPQGWSAKVMEADGLLATFGEGAFDYVQMIETAEHLHEHEQRSIVEQLIKVSRRYVVVTSMGIFHHLGPANEALCKVNPFMAYKGQPNPEMLEGLGMNVVVVRGYQIIGWMDKQAIK